MLKTILPVLSLADNCHLKNQTCSMVELIVPICYNYKTKCTEDCFFSQSFDTAFGLKMEIRNSLVCDQSSERLVQGDLCIHHCLKVTNVYFIIGGFLYASLLPQDQGYSQKCWGQAQLCLAQASCIQNTPSKAITIHKTQDPVHPNWIQLHFTFGRYKSMISHHHTINHSFGPFNPFV